MSFSKPIELKYTYSTKQQQQLVVDNFIFSKSKPRPNGINSLNLLIIAY